MLKHVYEHLITKRKYNRLQIYCDCLKNDLQQRTNERDTYKKLRDVEFNKFNETLDSYIEEIAKLKEKNKKLRDKLK